MSEWIVFKKEKKNLIPAVFVRRHLNLSLSFFAIRKFTQTMFLFHPSFIKIKQFLNMIQVMILKMKRFLNTNRIQLMILAKILPLRMKIYWFQFNI